MWILLMVAAIFGVLGVMIRFLKWYWLISGYNTMTRERKSQVDIERLGRFMGNFLFILAGVMALGCVAAYYKVPGVYYAVPLIAAVLFIYMLVQAQQYDAGARNPDGTLTRSTKIIIGSFIAFLVIIGVLVYAGTFPSQIVVGSESIQIKGLYGIEVAFDEINKVTMGETVPRILKRTNGFSAGGTLKGHFELQDIGRARLYINVNNPPFITIDTDGGLVIVNQENRKSTEELYRVLTGGIRP